MFGRLNIYKTDKVQLTQVEPGFRKIDFFRRNFFQDL